MSLEIVKEIKVDFHDTKYISVNAKQYDMGRYISITCYNQGQLFPIDKVQNYAFVRYRKPDELNVFNSCEITDDGRILIELTQQMLTFIGRAYVDIVIMHVEPVSPDSITVNTGELLSIENTKILSTMLLTVNTIGSAIDNQEIESTNEYNALNELMIKALNDYTYVMTASKISAENALESEQKAKVSEEKSLASETNAKLSEQSANSSEINARISEENALNSEMNAKASEVAALEAKKVAIEKSNMIVESADIVSEKTDIVLSQAEEINNNALLAKSYAIGETGQRQGEDTDNAKYYYRMAKATSENIDGGFIVIKSIEFSELQSVEKENGYTYHIVDDFITDDTFEIGAGVSYPAGTNVYYTKAGMWDCLTTSSLIDVNFIMADDDDGNVTIEFYTM